MIVSETCQLIWDRLEPIFIKTPTTASEWKTVSDRFMERWHFPNCIGALDGKHCRIQAPPLSGSLDYNFHQFFSVNLMALCDADYRFLFVDIGSYGHNNDAGVFSTSTLGIKFAQNQCNLPPPTYLPGTTVNRIPYFIVADDIFALKPYLMKPFSGANGKLSKQQRIFNGRLSAARRCSENTFGIATNKWRTLRTAVIADRANACRYFRAICCLHNFCRTEMDTAYCADNVDNNGELIIDAIDILPQMDDHRLKKDNHPLAAATRQRELLCDYVNGIGAVPWQEQKYAKYY
jgi:hypothetical protein